LKAEYVGLLGWIAGIYLALEIIIAPESAALVVFRNAVRGGKLSLEWYRVSGIVGVIIMLIMMYMTVMQIVGSSP
jgi:hypothetical protein